MNFTTPQSHKCTSCNILILKNGDYINDPVCIDGRPYCGQCGKPKKGDAKNKIKSKKSGWFQAGEQT